MQPQDTPAGIVTESLLTGRRPAEGWNALFTQGTPNKGGDSVGPWAGLWFVTVGIWPSA